MKNFSCVLVVTGKVIWTTDHGESDGVEGCDGMTLDVCLVSWMKIEGDETEIGDVEKMVVTVEEKLVSAAFDWMLVHQLPLGVWLVVSPQAFLVVPSWL